MTKHASFWAFLMSAVATGVGAHAAQVPGLTFIEPNLGQASADYSHVARANGYTALLRADGAQFVTSVAPRTPSDDAAEHISPAKPARRALPSAVRMQLLNANSAPAGAPGAALPGHSNYLYGSDAKRWLTGVPHFASLRFEEVYPGIDVVYTLEAGAVRYDFVLAPNANVADIQLQFDGADRVAINASGELVVGVNDVEMLHSQPRIFQTIEGQESAVEGGFVAGDDGILAFHVARHDPDTALIIDPQVTFSTYLGGSAADSAQDIVVDATGRMIVSGTTNSLDFPGAGGIAPAPTGFADIFVARLSSDGQTLEFATYIGGTGDDNPHQVELDSTGNILLAGYTTSADFPTVNAFQSTFQGGGLFDSDAFLAKLDPTGATLIYSTYFGGGAPSEGLFGFEWARGLVVDDLDNAYIVGETSAPDFPANDTIGGRNCVEGEAGAVSPLIGDAFVARFTPTGALDFAVCIGGAERDTGRGIALAADGAIHITGFTRSSDYPVSANAFQSQLAVPGSGFYDAHVTRLDPSGTLIDFASFVGGSETEFAQQIRILSDASSVVVGSTFSLDFPTTAGAYQTQKGGATNQTDDAIVFRLAAGGTSLQFGTYLGGSDSDLGWGLDIDADERIYLAASTESTDFPLVNATQPIRGGPGALVGTLGPATDVVRDLVSGNILSGGLNTPVLVAVNAGQSRVYDFDTTISLQNTTDIGASTDNSVAGALYDSDFDSLANAIVLVNRDGPSQAFFTDGAGGYLPPVDLLPTNPNPTSAAIGFVLDSGEPDLIVGNNGAPNVVYPGALTGFGAGVQVMPGSELTATQALAAGDLNNDGFSDVVEANDGQNRVYLGNGLGFAPGVALGSTSDLSTSVALADMNSDGLLDAIIGNDGAPDLVFLGDGTGGFGPQQPLGGVASTRDLAAASINRDFFTDIITANIDAGVAYISDAVGAYSEQSLTAAAAPATSITAGPAGTYRAPTGGAIEALNISLADSYLAALDPSGRELLFSTYLGGAGSDRSDWGLYVQDSANVYVAGGTSARDFPTVMPLQAANAGSGSAYVTRFALDDLTNPSPSVAYETVIDLAEPTIDGVDQIVIRWSTLNCGESAAASLYDYELLLFSDGQIVYSDPVVRGGILQAFRDVQRDDLTWDFDLGTLTLRQFNTGIDLLIDQPPAFGTNYLVTDGVSLPEDGLILISRYDDGAFVAGDEVEIAGQTTFIVFGDCDADGVDAAADNCLNEPNADQRDTDGDNIGNACDADLNNDCIVNVLDLGLLRTVFFTSDANADFNGDGVVNVLDLGVFRQAFFATPGPSGLPNACQ